VIALVGKLGKQITPVFIGAAVIGHLQYCQSHAELPERFFLT